MQNVNIMGVEVSDLSRAEALAKVRNFIEGNFQHYIVTPNPEIVLEANKDGNLRTIINHADIALPDGIGLKIASRILGINLNNRIQGADFVEAISLFAEQENWPIFLLGGINEKVTEQAAWRLRYQYKSLKVVGHASGGVLEFNEGKWKSSDNKLIEKINSSGAVILFVGFGCPKQEKWIFQNLDKLPNVKLAMTVGGTLDYIAGVKKRAPKFLRKIGMEWLWRLIIEPSRIKRIWQATFVFVWTAIKWRYRMKFVHRKNVAAFIINNDNEVLLIQRANEKDVHWQFPQGGVDKGEREEDAVLREAQEETGLTNLEIIAVHPNTHTYDWGQWHSLNGGYKGQSQSIYYLKYLGANEDVKPDPEEISHHRWIFIDDVYGQVHEKRREMTQMAIEGYKAMTTT
jgi:N-acetylglucosaminyldiphosphoundecaprenol N-acetyl-beta-D-mannosaminyltransferase